MRAAILARVSTEKQAAADRHSLPMQRQLLEDLAARLGYELVRTFEIRGESAYKDDIALRPQFLAAIEFAEGGGCDAILVYDFSRFARSQVVAHTALYRLKLAGVKLIGANGMDYVEEEDWAGMEGVMARRASRDHGRRVREALARRHSLGLWTGDLPFGYASNGPSSAPSVVEEEAEAIRWAYAHFVTHGSYVAIAREFNRRGLRPRSKRRRYGGVVYPANEEFTTTSVQRILESQFYLGRVVHRGTHREGLHEAIIDAELWAAVQSRKRRGTRAPRTSALLSGLAVCCRCGRPLWNERAGNGVRYYRERPRGLSEECPNAKGSGMRADAVHAALDVVFSGMWADRAFLEAVEAEALTPTFDVRAIERERATLREQRLRLARALSRGAITAEEHAILVAEINVQLGSLPSAPPPASKGSAGWLQDLGQLWDVADENDRRELVRDMLQAVEFDLSTRRVAVRPWPDVARVFERRRAWVCGEVRGTTASPGGLAVAGVFGTPGRI